MAADRMPPKLWRLIKAYYASTKMKVSASEYDSMPFKIRSGVRKGFSLSHTFFNYIIDWILVQALQGNPRVQVGTNVHVSDLAYADGSVIVRSSSREMQGLLEAVNRHAAAVGMRINASKTKVMSALIPSEQRQAVLLDDEHLEDVGKF